MKDLVFVYSYDFCSNTTALYVDGVLINDDVRVLDDNLLVALGYKNIPKLRVEIEWIEDLGFVFPDKLEDVVLAEENKG